MTGKHSQTPLDADERELANIVRALPHHEPPSALDEKILAQARTAAESVDTVPSPRRYGRWLGWSWGAGVAATAVLAAGIGWHLRPVLDTSPASPVADTAPAPMAESQRLEVELNGSRASDSSADMIVVPPPPMITPPESFSTPSARAANKVSQPQGNASMMMDSQQNQLPTSQTMAEAAPAIADSFSESTQESPIDSELARQSEPMETPEDRLSLQRQQASDLSMEGYNRVRNDSRLPIHQWLQKIRLRYQSGDIEGATASLLLFQHRHPKTHLPGDLVRLTTKHQD